MLEALEANVEIVKLAVSVLGFGGTIWALLLGLRQYRRAELWRRREFVAKEVKEFQSQPAIRNAFLMIDWSRRRINLDQDPTIPYAEWPDITREVVWKALLPHSIKGDFPEWSSHGPRAEIEDGEGRRGLFTRNESMIRDTFDSFLEGFERFATFVESSLVSAKEFRPYLRYWIDDLATDQGDANDARWRCTFLTYISFYRFNGVVTLFQEFGHDITTSGPIFEKLRVRMNDDPLYRALLRSADAGLYGSTIGIEVA